MMSGVFMSANDLRESREALGLTQAGMAKELGMALRQYGDMERGVLAISKRTRLAVGALIIGLEDYPASEASLQKARRTLLQYERKPRIKVLPG